MDPLPCMLILAVLTLLCAAVEISSKAVLSQNQKSIKKLFGDENDKVKNMSQVLENSAEIEARADVAMLFLLIAGGALSAFEFGSSFADIPAFEALNSYVARYLSFVIVFLITFVIEVIVGIRLPSKLGQKYTDKLCIATLPVLKFFTAFFLPLHAIIDFVAGLLARLAGVSPNDITEDVTEDEIRQMIDEAGESGSIEESETDMIHSIFEFDDREVSEILTHRTDIFAVELSAGLDEVLEVIKKGGFSRIPVYKETLDDVVGILYVKDLVKLIGDLGAAGIGEFSLSDYTRKALYIPETNSLKDLFEKFKSERIQMAVVVDEYGGTLGIVTMEDLIESIMGSINDEFDDDCDESEEQAICRVSETEFRVKGLTPLKNVEEELGIIFENDENCDTIGGLVVSLLGVIPGNDEQPELDIDSVTVKVISVVEHHIEELIIVKNTDEEDGERGVDDADEA